MLRPLLRPCSALNAMRRYGRGSLRKATSACSSLAGVSVRRRPWTYTGHWCETRRIQEPYPCLFPLGYPAHGGFHLPRGPCPPLQSHVASRTYRAAHEPANPGAVAPAPFLFFYRVPLCAPPRVRGPLFYLPPPAFHFAPPSLLPPP